MFNCWNMRLAAESNGPEIIMKFCPAEQEGDLLAMMGMPQTIRARRLDREAEIFLRLANPFFNWTASEEHIDMLRRGWSSLAKALGRKVPVASVVDREIDGPAGRMTLRIYTPDRRSDLKPGFLWCHGGGFVVGDLDANDSICRSVARASGAIVVAVRYRMAPEHCLYSGREDFLTALRWVASHGRAHGIDPKRLAIGGDSAGGNISAAVAQENLRRGGPALQRQVLVYPATNLVEEFASTQENASGYMLTADFIDSLKYLINRGEDMTDPWLSPAFASPALLRALPPATIVTAGFDPIRDDGLAYADKLRMAGVPVELLHYPGQFHGFLNFDSIDSAARDAEARIGAALSAAFASEAAADRTVEIADDMQADGVSGQVAVAGTLTAAMLVSRLTRQWCGEAARMLSPEGAQLAKMMLRPWWVPVALTRRSFTNYLNTPSPQQTYPLSMTG